MKKRVLAIFLIFAFIFTSTAGVYAKGFRSSGRSFSKSYSRSAKSYSNTGGFSGSSKSSGGGFKSSKSSNTGSKSGSSGSSSGSYGSSSRSIPGSSSNGWSSSSKSSAKGFSNKTSSKKYSYMQDAYKKQASAKSFNTYKQKLNTEQQKVYNDSLKRSYGTSSRRMNFEEAMNTRSSRINVFSKRPIFVNINTGMFSSPFSYGYAYVGPWDLWFLTRASELFWFHHWNEISPYRSYFNQQEFNNLERRVHQLEQQGVQRDPNYMDTDVDPDLQLSQQYQEQNVDKVYYTDKYPTSSNSAGAVVVVIVTAVVLIIVIKKISKPKKNKSNYSRIY